MPKLRKNRYAWYNPFGPIGAKWYDYIMSAPGPVYQPRHDIENPRPRKGRKRAMTDPRYTKRRTPSQILKDTPLPDRGDPVSLKDAYDYLIRQKQGPKQKKQKIDRAYPDPVDWQLAIEGAMAALIEKQMEADPKPKKRFRHAGRSAWYINRRKIKQGDIYIVRAKKRAKTIKSKRYYVNK